MNNWTGIGHLTADPETRESQTGTAICRFRIAVNDRDEANFISVVAFGKQAESCGRYLKKGSKVAVNGRIKTGSYTKQDGTKVYTTDINANTVEFLTPRQTEVEPQDTFGEQTGFGDIGDPSWV